MARAFTRQVHEAGASHGQEFPEARDLTRPEASEGQGLHLAWGGGGRQRKLTAGRSDRNPGLAKSCDPW